MIQSFFVVSDSGEVILEKQWSDKGGDRSVCAHYWSQRLAEEAGRLTEGSANAGGAAAAGDGAAVLASGTEDFDSFIPLSSAEEPYLRNGHDQASEGATEEGGIGSNGNKKPGVSHNGIRSAPMPPAVSSLLYPSQGVVMSLPRCYVLSLDCGASGGTGDPGKDKGSVVFVATTSKEMQPLVGLELLKLLEGVLVVYLGSVTEDLLKDNFVTVYNVLDEIVAFGLPLAPDLQLLKEIVPPPSVISKVVDKLTGGVGTLSTSSWSSPSTPTSAVAAAGAAAAAAAAPVSQLFAAATAAMSGSGGGAGGPAAGAASGAGSSSRGGAFGPGTESGRLVSGIGSGPGSSGAHVAGASSGSKGGTAISSASMPGVPGLGPRGGGITGISSNVVPWRRIAPKYMHNEITFEFREELDVVVGSDGTLRRADVFGRLHVTSKLSGTPDMVLSFVNHSLLSDVALHRCVRSNVWNSDRVVSCIPPDGPFTLLTYRVMGVQAVPIYVKPQVTFQGATGRVSIMVGTTNHNASKNSQQQQQLAKQPQVLHLHPTSSASSDPQGASGPGSQKPVDMLSLRLNLPETVTTCELSANVGSVLFDSVAKVVIWDIGRMPRDKLPCLSGSVQLQKGVLRPLGRPTVSVSFRVAGAALSGLRVESVGIHNETYFVHKGYKSSTHATRFEVRT